MTQAGNMLGESQYYRGPAGYHHADDQEDVGHYGHADSATGGAEGNERLTGDAEYRRKGPPALLLRILGPFVILTSLAVIGTGVILAFTGPAASIWLLAHKAAFVLWFGVMTVHVLAYVWRLPKLVGSDVVRQAGHRAEQVLGGRAARWLLLTASLLTGLLLAVITVHLAGSWTSVPGLGR